MTEPVHEWLMEGDPAIRWRAMRDLTDEVAQRVAAERALVATTGWGARLLALQADDGMWSVHGNQYSDGHRGVPQDKGQHGCQQ